MITVDVEGHGTFFATARRVAQVEGRPKQQLVRELAQAWEGTVYGTQAYWLRHPKTFLVVIACNLWPTEDVT
jgi:hypothetical protein